MGEETDRIVPGHDPGRAPVIDTSVAHLARVYDYWLGGKDNFPADREAAEQAIAAYPMLPRSARSNRAFMRRAVRFLAAEAGIRQFLDIGTGIPTSPNVHEVAQAVAPESRIVYADNDPIVLVHARALLTRGPEGLTDYIDGDVHDPDSILDTAAKTLDLTRPVGLLLVAILHVVRDAQEAAGIVARLLAAVPPGSYLVLSHVAKDVQEEQVAEMMARLSRLLHVELAARTSAEVSRFFEGLELVAPGVVQVHRWRPDQGVDLGEEFPMHGGVARKP